MSSKFIVYQLLVRLFGNKNTNNVFYGSRMENGVGKFNDITASALHGLKELSVTHIWYTGVIEHATMSDYRMFGIALDDPDVVKGRAGSPYAIKDYYDVDPDLAVDVDYRMREFEQLIRRTHEAGLKAIIDFVPNHVARNYQSDVKPKGVVDLGEEDIKTVDFAPSNNFYYLPNQTFQVPKDYKSGGEHFESPLKNGDYVEFPAKATGNDVFSASPSVNDWFETVKLNYGVDYATNTSYFDPIPSTWHKMTDILLFWADKGIDGFRCDMCEMVPVEFWSYAIEKVKASHPTIIFIGEAYSTANYERLIESGGFDYLYDKDGLYDTLRAIGRREASFDRMSAYLQSEVKGIEQNMLSFLENHDEQRIASRFFLGNPTDAIPIMTITASLNKGPVMIYSGQEVGATGEGATGFSGDDGRTSIYDYTHIPELQQWVNQGAFDGGGLNEQQRHLRDFYKRLLHACVTEEAIAQGDFFDLQYCNGEGRSEGYNEFQNYAYMRYTSNSRVLVVVTTDSVAMHTYLKIPKILFDNCELEPDAHYHIVDLLGSNFDIVLTGVALLGNGYANSGLPVSMPGKQAMLLKIVQQ